MVETWLYDSDSSVIASFVPNTHVFHHFTRPSGRGGGVGIVLSRTFQNVKSYNRFNDTFECIELHATCQGTKVVFSVIYRPPAIRFLSFIHEYEKYVLECEKNNKHVFYLGDFNIWMDDAEAPDTKKMVSFLDSFSLKNFVTCETHRSGHTLDLVIAHKNSILLSDVLVDSTADLISDHKPIFFGIKLQLMHKVFKSIKFRKIDNNFPEYIINNLNFSLFSNAVSCVHSSVSCISCYVELFRQISKDIYDSYCPPTVKTIQILDKSRKWFNIDVLNAKKNLRKAEKKYKNRSTPENREDYLRLRNLKCSAITSAKRDYLYKTIEECNNDPRKIYNHLNSFLGKSNKVVSFPSHTSKTDLCNKFKNFFIDKIIRIVDSFGNSDPSSLNLIPDIPMKNIDIFSPITDAVAFSIIMKMNKTYCLNDPFNIKKFETKDFECLAHFFADIANMSFDCGIFPESEKYAFIAPLLKKNGDVDDLSSYRPLYKTSFLSKFLEKCVLQQLMDHISKFEFLPCFQSAYREFHSVETALCRVFNDLNKVKSQGGCSILILLDLSSAFDTIDRSLLLDDLKFLGINGKALQFIASYLTDRKFRVTIEDFQSDEGVMQSGVPQGTILGPALFIIYTSSLQYVLREFGVSFHLYADDTQIYFRLEPNHVNVANIKKISEAVGIWMRSRKLKMNAGKTEIMIIGSTNNIQIAQSEFDHMVNFCDTTVVLSEKLKNLGFIFDQSLTLSNQINNVKRKAIGGLINISHISSIINKKYRLQLVHSLVISHLDFCNSLYYGLSDRELHSLQMLLNSAARIVVNWPRFSRNRITPVCIQLHFLPVKARIEFKICLLVFKALKYGKPSYISELLKPYIPLSNVQLRNSGRLFEPLISGLVSSERCFEYHAPRLFNSIPDDIKAVNSVDNFKKKLKTHLFLKAYNISEQSINSAYSV